MLNQISLFIVFVKFIFFSVASVLLYGFIKRAGTITADHFCQNLASCLAVCKAILFSVHNSPPEIVTVIVWCVIIKTNGTFILTKKIINLSVCYILQSSNAPQKKYSIASEGGMLKILIICSASAIDISEIFLIFLPKVHDEIPSKSEIAA